MTKTKNRKTRAKKTREVARHRAHSETRGGPVPHEFEVSRPHELQMKNKKTNKNKTKGGQKKVKAKKRQKRVRKGRQKKRQQKKGEKRAKRK